MGTGPSPLLPKRGILFLELMSMWLKGTIVGGLENKLHSCDCSTVALGVNDVLESWTYSCSYICIVDIIAEVLAVYKVVAVFQ